MTLGFTTSGFFVNSASGIATDRLVRNGIHLTDARGMISLERVASEASDQGLDVTVETIADMLVIGRVATRWELERLTGRGKRQANRIMQQHCVVNSAPGRVAGQPAWTVGQLAELAAIHDAQARQNKVRPLREAVTNANGGTELPSSP